jgi:predicted anti-sigma-YlaC factor YlaD
VNSPQETELGRELRQLVSGQPFTPDADAIGLRARQRHRRGLALRGATAAGAAVLAAGGLFAAVHGTGGTAAGTAASPAPALKSKLIRPR